MLDQIKIIDYRNACYQGMLVNGAFQRFGAVLTQDLLFCLAYWKKGIMSGPCFTIFQDQKIFYGDFHDNNPDGLCCYQIGQQCQFYCIFDQGKMRNFCLAVFPFIRCVLQIFLDTKQDISKSQQHYFQSNQQKWGIIEKLINGKVPDFMKSINKFMNESFMGKTNLIQQVFGEEQYFGFKGEGLGFKINRKQHEVASIGYYDADKVLKYMGKRIINEEKKVREEGIYSRPDTLIRYLQRPPILRKTYRNFLRQSINFQNKFIQLPNLQKVQIQFKKLKQKIKDGTTQKIAQQLIEHLDQNNRILPDFTNNSNNTGNRTQLLNVTQQDRSFHRPKQQVSLLELKEELNRSMSNKKSKGNSPYKKYNPQPAQLRYTSKTNKKTQVGRNKDRADEYQVPYKSPYTSPYITKNQEEYNYEPKIRYPIEDNLRTINKKTPSRSPLKTQQRPTKNLYQYMQDSNPQLSERQKDRYPGVIYEKPIKTNLREYSPLPERKQNSSRNKDRLDKLEKLYDQIQHEKNYKIPNNYEDQYQNRKYPSNKGNGYRYIQQDSLDNRTGLARPNRTLYEPRNRSRSPLYTQQNYTRTYQTPKYTDYDIDRNYRGREEKNRYGYFDKNR